MIPVGPLVLVSLACTLSRTTIPCVNSRFQATSPAQAIGLQLVFFGSVAHLRLLRGRPSPGKRSCADRAGTQGKRRRPLGSGYSIRTAPAAWSR